MQATLTIEGYKPLRVTLEREPTVADALHGNGIVMWLHADILAIPAASCVGSAVVDLAQRVAPLLSREYGNAEEHTQLEDSTREDLVKAVVAQANVWYFG